MNEKDFKLPYQPNVQRWMDFIEHDHSVEALAKVIADDAVMFSPVVFTPQRGKMITIAYLMAAAETIGNDKFKYTKVFDCRDRAVLEFETEMDGIYVNGVDIIQWNEDGQITEFKVMIRPLKAVQVVHAQMAKMLEELREKQKHSYP
ncbi:MAG: nuclear transport factor 2 family protein [Hyphomicrobiales bacterium]|nr:nuclear transport factor 2 family protein [Hyphomicrobiales bacterium]